MRIALFDDYRVGAVQDELIYDLTPALPGWTPGDEDFVNKFIKAYPHLQPALKSLVANGSGLPVKSVTFRAPAPKPRQLLAAPLNYQAHRDEMTGSLTSGAGTADNLGFFLKAPGSISDPSSRVELPALAGRRMDFEAEIAVVVGRCARGIAPEDALKYVFGYTIILDMTLRMTETEREERTMRKSYATFSPMGPWIVTSDEIADPSAITLKAWRNGELRQDATLRDLIVSVPQLLSRASHVLPLEPGDVYATGSPAGVGQVTPGDTIVVDSPQIGRLELEITTRLW